MENHSYQGHQLSHPFNGWWVYSRRLLVGTEVAFSKVWVLLNVLLFWVIKGLLAVNGRSQGYYLKSFVLLVLTRLIRLSWVDALVVIKPISQVLYTLAPLFVLGCRYILILGCSVLSLERISDGELSCILIGDILKARQSFSPFMESILPLVHSPLAKVFSCRASKYRSINFFFILKPQQCVELTLQASGNSLHSSQLLINSSELCLFLLFVCVLRISDRMVWFIL